MIAANKNTIYPEYLPNYIRRSGNISRTDQLIAVLPENSDIEIVDTRDALQQSKNSNPGLRLYHRTDTHWNEVGTFMANKTIAEKVALSCPTIQPLGWNDIAVEPTISEGGDLARMLGIGDRYREFALNIDILDSHRLSLENDDPSDVVRLGNGQAKDPALVMFQDSFGVRLSPLLAKHFRSALFVRIDDFNTKIIDIEKLDFVISELVERKFMNEPPKMVPTAVLSDDLQPVDHSLAPSTGK